jgi:SnoaL-like domain
MRESSSAAQAWVRFCEGVSERKIDQFDDVVSQEAKLIIGTAPGEMVTERERMRFGFETEGITLESRSPTGYEEGSLAWVVDEPRFGFPDGSSFDCRVTAVVRRVEAVWRIVHAHFSVGVPDEEVVGLQQKWSASL